MTDSHALDAAVQLLLRRPSLRIDFGPLVYAPCLLQQLAEDVVSSLNGGGGRTTPGSKALIDHAALDLWVEIASSVGAWAVVLGVDRSRYRVGDQSYASPHHRGEGTEHVPPLGLLLRSVAATAVSRPDRAALAEKVEANCRTWARRIGRRSTRNPEDDHDLPGVPCPRCGTTWVVAVPEPGEERIVWELAEDFPYETRAAAVFVERGETGVIRCLWCRACGQYMWRSELSSIAQTEL